MGTITDGVFGAASDTVTSMSASGPAVIVLMACIMGLAFATFLWTLVAQVKVGEDKLSSTAALLPSNSASTHRYVFATTKTKKSNHILTRADTHDRRRRQHIHT